ncbi:MAG: leucine-rich repeat domain-containing protein [Christensenellales bacterium]
MKKLWTWLLAAALLITGCAVQGNTARAAGNGEPEERVSGYFTYTLNDSGEAVITRYSGGDRELTVPDKVDGYPVAEIGAEAFSFCYNLTGITLPEGLQRIGDRAFFECESLTGITLPEGLQNIGDGAFHGCISLTGITLPDSLKTMGDNPFERTKAELLLSPDHPHFALVDGMLIHKGEKCLVCYPYGSRAETCVVPEGILQIGDSAFSSCSSLTGITLPEGLQSIGNDAFFLCSSLTSIALPEGLQSIGNDAFSYCRNLTNIALPEGLQSIGDWAFLCCYSLTGITLPEGLQSIGDRAFSWCDSLTGITLPDSLETMGDNPFERTKTELSLSPDHPRFALVDGMLIDKEEKRLVCYPYGSRAETCVVPEGILHIGNWAFSYCDSLTGITLPKGLQSIGDEAFSYCSNLTSITLPEGLQSIGGWAFSDCARLTSLSIPASVTVIKPDAFDNCPSLTLTVAPNSIGAAYANDNGIPFVYAE